jgi:uncharacterized YccA/Bax inhibitor family protein
MALFESNNPVLQKDTFKNVPSDYAKDGVMTINGTITKMAFLLLMLTAAAIYAWGVPARGQNPMPFLLVGGIGGFILAITIKIKKEWAPYLAPAYALAEGLFLGVLSVMYAAMYDGIVLKAVGLTIATFFSMLVLYRARIIRATEKFRAVMFIAVSGIALFYLAAMVLHIFNIQMPFLHDGSTMSIVISLVIVCVAALNLILYFDMIETGATEGAPKYFEWFASFALLVGLVWLYLEILRLLSNSNSRR